MQEPTQPWNKQCRPAVRVPSCSPSVHMPSKLCSRLIVAWPGAPRRNEHCARLDAYLGRGSEVGRQTW
eukprot:5207045-Alexandrium_andersonii.AAC.1